jgi:hypothetical protein
MAFMGTFAVWEQGAKMPMLVGYMPYGQSGLKRLGVIRGSLPAVALLRYSLSTFNSKRIGIDGCSALNGCLR